MEWPEQTERIVTEIADGECFVAHALGPEDGELALLLHGFPDLPLSWLPVAVRLARRGVRVVMPYARGYAPSTLRGPFDPERLADDVVALADALVARRSAVHLVGHDWGAVAAYLAALRAPDRFASLVTLSVPHPLAFLGALTRSQRQRRRSWYMAFFQLPRWPEEAIRRGLVRRLWRAWSPSLEPDEDHLAAVERCLRVSGGAPLEYYRAAAWPPGPAWARIRAYRGATVSSPTLYLHGAEDGCIRPGYGQTHMRFFTGPAREIVIGGAGHFMQLERPAEVAAHVGAWLSAHGGAGGSEGDA